MNAPAPSGSPKRIFWLSAHVVLVATELPFLRSLGYEVFNPAYLTPIYDQSAHMDWDANQPTTLPPEIFAKLGKTNFFYQDLSDETADILNRYFDIVIVAVAPLFLGPILKKFRGTIIFRTFGQHQNLSNEIIERGLWPRLIAHPNFHIVPFCDEVCADEAPWFQERCLTSVPYTLSLETFHYRDSWRDFPHARRIMVSVPNIANPFFNAMYQKINTVFPESFIKIYGVQRGQIDDPRVMGTLDRETLLREFQHSAGYFYCYQDRNVCYLPPIEMMVIGGPVVFAENSLLHRFMGNDAPGLGRTPDEIRDKMHLLLRQDQSFINEVIASQEETRRRYDPNYVDPIFAKVMRDLLDRCPPSLGPLQIEGSSLGAVATGDAAPILTVVAHLAPAKAKIWSDLPAMAIRRKTLALVIASLQETDFHVLTTVYSRDLPEYYTELRQWIVAGRATLLTVDKAKLDIDRPQHDIDMTDYMFRRIAERSDAAPSGTEALSESLTDAIDRLRTVNLINENQSVFAVIIPGTDLFPELLSLRKPIVNFIPDELAAIFPEIEREKAVDEENLNPADLAGPDQQPDLGRVLAARSSHILLQSMGWRENAAHFLGISPEKIKSIGGLAMVSAQLSDKLESSLSKIIVEIADRPFIWAPYVGINRDDQTNILGAFSLLAEALPNLALLAGSTADSDLASCQEMAERLGLAQRVIWVSGLDPSAENFLFQTCEAAYLTVLSAEKLRRTIGRCVLLVPEGAEFSALGVTHPAILPVGRQDIDVIAQQLRSALRDRDAILTREQDQSQALGDVGNASATSLSYQGVLAEVLTELWRTGGETVGQPSGHPGIAAS